MSIYELGETNPSYEGEEINNDQDSIDVFQGSSDVTETTFINDDDPEKIEPVKTPEASGSKIADTQPEAPGSRIAGQQNEIKLQIMKKFFEHMGFDENSIGLNLDLFRVVSHDGFNILEFKKGERWFNLTNKNTGEFKTPGEINKILTKKKIIQFGVIKTLDDNIPTPREIDKMEPKQLKKKLNNVRNILSEMPQMRELLALDKALQRLDGEFLNNTAKLTELENDIARQKTKLNDEISEEQKTIIKKRLNDFQDEYKVRMETLSLQKTKLQTQFARIRQTIDKIADKDRSLKERLNILWREQGLTITSVLTAVGLTISTLVLALIPRGGAAGGAGGSGSNPHRVRDWVKRGLKALARVFGRIAKWALAALPGAIGSIISWIFSLLKTVVTKAGEHAYAVVGFIAVFISYFLFKNQTSPTNARLPNKTRL